MSQPQSLLSRLPQEIFLSGVYPFLLKKPPFELMMDSGMTCGDPFDIHWTRFLNTSKSFTFLKKSTRYILLKRPGVVTRFLKDETFRNSVFSLVSDKSAQIGIDFRDCYRNQPSNITEFHHGSLFFPLLNDLHYVNLSSVKIKSSYTHPISDLVFMDGRHIFSIKNIAYLSLFALNLEQMNLTGNILSLCLKDCVGIDFRRIPASVCWLSLSSCAIISDLSCLSSNIKKLQLLHCSGIKKEGIKSLNFLNFFHFTSATNAGEFREIDYSEVCSDVSEIQISFYSMSISYRLDCIDVNRFKNVVSLTLNSFRSETGFISGLQQLKYLDINMKAGCDSK
jgi:hypothetical protein